jgi:hypothetical protein
VDWSGMSFMLTNSKYGSDDIASGLRSRAGALRAAVQARRRTGLVGDLAGRLGARTVHAIPAALRQNQKSPA